MNTDSTLKATALLVACVVSALAVPASGQPDDTTARPRVIRDEKAVAPKASRSTNRGALTESEADALEAQLSSDPNQPDLQSRLLRHYFSLAGREARRARAPHALWLIEHAPESEIAGSALAGFEVALEPETYDQARQLWLGHVTARGDDPRILRNAARFFMRGDRVQAANLLRRGAALQPSEAWWRLRLAEVDLRVAGAPSAQPDRALAEQALAAYDEVMTEGNQEEADYTLAEAAQAALMAGHDQKARDYATRLLQRAEPPAEKNQHGYAIHEGNRILGQLALRSGDVETAKQHLLRAAATPGSPSLNTFGPSLTLASDLLAKGERDAVVAYLELCSRFWEGRSEAIARWISEIRAGRSPDLNRFHAHRTPS